MSDEAALLERLWYGRDGLARLARVALSPAALLYGTGAWARGALYDLGALPVHPTAIPALAVGNVTVGGTGKTPLSAWLAARLVARGARPAIVLRGFGDDEPLVHRALNPGVPVIAEADRVEGIARARAAGADVAVLDDAFQHRRAERVADVVLVSADRWREGAGLLPAGPLREPLRALRRATLVVVTRKAVSRDAAEEVAAAVGRTAPGVPVAVASLAADGLRGNDGAERPLATLAGRRVLAVSAIGDPTAFVRQLEGAGAIVTARSFADHHAYSDEDVTRLAEEGGRVGEVVCTLKDLVKLGPVWPRAGAGLWYVTQRVTLERGGDAMDRVLDLVLEARHSHPHRAGSGRP